jgi:hypothetical protein
VGEEAEELHLLAVRHFHSFIDSAAECVLETTKVEEEDEVYDTKTVQSFGRSQFSRFLYFTKIKKVLDI